jgi:hypothetical protein
VSLSSAEWQTTVLQTLAKFLTLPEQSDAAWCVKRPTPKAYKAAVDLISEVPVSSLASLPIPRVAPDRQGGIQFEWEKGPYALEIGISPSGSYEVLKATPTSEEEGHLTFNKARESIVWLARV